MEVVKRHWLALLLAYIIGGLFPFSKLTSMVGLKLGTAA